MHAKSRSGGAALMAAMCRATGRPALAAGPGRVREQAAAHPADRLPSSATPISFHPAKD